MRGEEFIESALRLGEHGAAGLPLGLLLEQADAGAGVEADVAVVGPILPGEQAQQSRLADAVRPNQADAVASEDLEADPGKQRPLVEAAREVGTAQ